MAPIPRLVSQEQFDQVQAKRAHNRQFARRHNTAHRSLLRALVSGGDCGECRLACTGRSAHPGYDYYLCRGKAHPIQSGRAHKCPARYIPAHQLDEVVWQDLCDVLLHPDSIAQALERAYGGHWAPQELQARREQLRRASASVTGQIERLTQAYLTAVMPLTEYHRRRLTLEHQLQAVERQVDQLDQLEPTEPTRGRCAAPAGPGWARAVRHSPSQSVAALCQRLQSGLDHATFEQKRQLIELLIDRVVVTNGAVEIRYVIPTTPASEHVRFCHLRTDYFHDVATRVDRLVEGQGTSRSCRSTGALIAAFRNGVRDLPLSEQLTTTQVAVAFVSDEPIGARARPVGLGCPPRPASIAYCHGDVLA